METTETEADTAQVASELRLVLGKLVRRLRAEKRLPIAHGAVLGRLERDGPRSASELATAERVRPQSMAQTLSDLERERLIVRTPHPTDRRRTLVTLTPQGLVTLREDRAQSQGWLEQAISEHLSSDERAALSRALGVLRTLADS